tara:strand:+ start:781 stop:1125 length:345 start_codon:yes stop_codon:yes gene_type:complete
MSMINWQIKAVRALLNDPDKTWSSDIDPVNDTITNITGDASSLSMSDINAKATELKNAGGYVEGRVGITSGYAPITTQLDQLWHDMKDGKLGAGATTGSWYVGISSVKSMFPKP